MKIQVKRIIKASSNDLWAYLADFSNISRFHPLLKGSRFNTSNHNCGVGCTRQCDMTDGNYIRERITDWKDGSHYSIDIYDTSMPIRNAKATLGVRSLSGETSEVYMDMEMDAKYPIMTPFVFYKFRFQAIPSILKGLEELHIQENRLSLA